MINKRIIIFVFFTSIAHADDFNCQKYNYELANNWLCSHLDRGIHKTRLPDSILSDKTDIDLKTIKRIEALVSQAELLHEEENYIKAEQNYRQIVKNHFSYAPGWIKFSQFYSAMDRDHDALQILQQGLLKIPDNADIYHETGLVQVRLRLVPQAVISLAKAAVKAPENVHYSYVYGIALNSTRRPYKAIDVLQQAHKRQPENIEILEALFLISQDLEQHNKALLFARKIQEIDPDNDSIQHYMIESKVIE
ncbi:MAG: hypothetical protein KAI17_20585 [Thiotrichaceae bacterium]|nr:hypothetical protein [Thiotrichaceae bacterium]